jgi:diguanylate cyclase (GGDEF)-like protein
MTRLSAAFGRVPSRLRVLGFAAALAVLGTVLLAVTPDVAVSPERAWTLPFFAAVIAFGAAEATALHVEIRKQSHSLSLSGVVLLFGVLYLSPLLLTSAFVFGAAPAMILIRKADWVKTTWNASLFFAEAALAALIVRSLLGFDFPDSAVEWLVPLGAMLAAELMSLVAVPLVIMASDATYRQGLFADIGRSQTVAVFAGMFTVTAAAAAASDQNMLIYAGVPMVGIGLLFKSAGQLAQRYSDLQRLHSFTRALTDERGARTVDAGLTHLVEIMRSRSAFLLTIGVDDEPTRLRILADDSLHDQDPEPVADRLLAVLDTLPVTELTRDDHRTTVRELLDDLDAERLLAVRVLGEVDRIGVVAVIDRLGMRSEFAVDEIRLFGSLADTLSSRLSNDYLVEQLEVQAQHDALTGLPNRLNFEVGLTAVSTKSDASGVVVMIDLDRFKEINDSLGHDTGDRLLIEVADRLRDQVRSSEMVARFGGDEFAILLVNRFSDAPGALERRLEDVHASLCDRVEIDGIEFEIGASMGISEWPKHGRDSTRLLHRADVAMYQAKRNQLGMVWYTPDLERDAPRRTDLYLSASLALDQGDFSVEIQPKVSAVDGRITGGEALLRWTHPKHGPVSPLEFVPLIDQAGLTGKMTRFVLARAIDAAAMCRDAGIEVPIAVNLTARDLLDPRLPGELQSLLADAGLPASAIQVEITENAMVVDFDTSVRVLSAMRAAGVRVAIDDFGTGYSSLQHLHRLPVDQLKIDRSFVGRLASDPSAAAIVRASVSLANDLGLVIVAEGVEDEQSLRFVAGLGCGEVQGYLISRSLPLLDFIAWSRRWNDTPPADRVRPFGPDAFVDQAAGSPPR